MLFNSAVFFIYFAIVYGLYWLLRHRLALQNTLLLIASYVFYGWWDWRFLSLLMLSTVVDFLVGKKLASTPSNTPETQRKRHLILLLSLGFNLGLLGTFKYFNFFADGLVQIMNAIGWHLDPMVLNVILPVGISFYTFQSMTYTIEVYREKLPATNNLLNFAVFVAFFPQLVAGPIERAIHLLP